MEENKITEYRKKNFVIAEISACVSFILNTVCVIMANRGGPFAPAWLPRFDSFYWLKTILAASGVFYYLISNAFTSKEVPRYISIITFIILLYSVPFINSLFLIPFASTLKVFRGSTFNFDDRITVQAIWSIPALILVLDLFVRLAKNQKNE